MRFNARRTSLVAVAALASSFVAAGCGGGGDSADDANEVTIWSSMDPPVQAGLEKTLTAQAEEAGYTIDWQKVDNINQLIMTKLQANDLPDIAFIPQPGVVADVVERGAGEPLDDVLDMAALEESMTPGTLEAGTIDDQLYGLLTSMNVKSLVFYHKKAFEEAGYEAPTSIDELNALTEQIKADGGTPWCMGIESDSRDRLAGHGLVRGPGDALRRRRRLQLRGSPTRRRSTPTWCARPRRSSRSSCSPRATCSAAARASPATRSAPRATRCSTRSPAAGSTSRARFITGFFPEEILADLDANVGVFGFPPAEAGGENPVLGGGDLAMMLDDSEATQAVMKLLAAPEIGEEAAGSSSFISPHKTFDVSKYPDEITRSYADVAYSSTAFLFDGSDQMPGEVGAGSFWKEMTAWISDQQDLDTTLTNIDDSWPAS